MIRACREKRITKTTVSLQDVCVALSLKRKIKLKHRIRLAVALAFRLVAGSPVTVTRSPGRRVGG